jgi:hypothetical protein
LSRGNPLHLGAKIKLIGSLIKTGFQPQLTDYLSLAFQSQEFLGLKLHIPSLFPPHDNVLLPPDYLIQLFKPCGTKQFLCVGPGTLVNLAYE